MAKYRQSNLLAAKSITTAGTEIVPINVRDPISRITIKTALTNASWTPTGHPAVAVTKVELVDGADVLHSMRGCYTAAVAFYGSKKQPFMYANYTDNGIAVATHPIYFGRRLWDPVLAFDPKRFTNPQLRITHNYALGGAAPDAATLEVWADLFDENPPTPMGFLSAKSIWSKTLVASATDYVDLPNDMPIRFVYPAAFSNVEEPDINIDNIKLTEEHDKRTIYEASVLNILQQIETLWPNFEEWMEGRGLTATDITFYLAPQKDLTIALDSSQDVDSYRNQIWTGGGIRKINCAATQTIMGRVFGRCPFGVIPVPMGEPDDIDSWWDVTKLGNARIKMTTGAGSTAAQYELLIEQLRKY